MVNTSSRSGKSKKAQYSFEFLITYAWAFLIIGVALAAIYSLGFFDFEDVLPEKCDFYGQTYCDDFEAYTEQATGDDNMRFILINRFGADLYVNDVNLFDGRNTGICDLEQPFNPRGAANIPSAYWPNGGLLLVNLTNCDVANSGPVDTWEGGTRFEAVINISFYNPSTADPEDGETPVFHTQLGDINVFIRET